MNKTLIADNIGVDAGMIMVADMDYLNSVPNRDTPETLGKVFKGIKKGIYRVQWLLPNDFENEENDPICEGVAELRVTSGSIFVCDPCYVIGNKDDNKHSRDEWLTWLENTNHGEELNDDRAFIIDEMGGDGCFEVILELEYVKPLPKKSNKK